MIEANVPWSIKELNITGSDVMQLLQIPPSPEVGHMLDMLWKECVACPQYNNPEKLKALIMAHKQDLLP
jgi:hypothetical protein